MELFHYQHVHVNRLWEKFQEYPILGDTSKTGSGKTHTATKLAKRFGTQGCSIVVVCPPTLRQQWEQCLDKEKLQAEILSIYKLSLPKTLHRYFLIIDECHYFKNSSMRTQNIQLLIHRAYRTLLISATPLDDLRQLPQMKRLFRADEITECCQKMAFMTPAITSYTLLHVLQTDEEKILYRKGWSRIKQSGYLGDETDTGRFAGGIYSKGWRQIHDSLCGGLIRQLTVLLATWTRAKFIAVLHFADHFDAVQDAFPDALVFNGKTAMSERAKILEKFQAPNLEHRLLLLSDCLAVGISLDDTHGDFPRHMICLPPNNGINFLQLVGRINRALTCSNSRVSIVQPYLCDTYFTRQMQRKFAVLGAFQSVPRFEHELERHKCAGHRWSRHLCTPPEIQDKIRAFLCDCLK